MTEPTVTPADLRPYSEKLGVRTEYDASAWWAKLRGLPAGVVVRTIERWPLGKPMDPAAVRQVALTEKASADARQRALNPSQCPHGTVETPAAPCPSCAASRREQASTRADQIRRELLAKRHQRHADA